MRALILVVFLGGCGFESVAAAVVKAEDAGVFPKVEPAPYYWHLYPGVCAALLRRSSDAGVVACAQSTACIDTFVDAGRTDVLGCARFPGVPLCGGCGP